MSIPLRDRLFIAIVALALGFGFWLAQRPQPPAPAPAVAPEPEPPLPDFSAFRDAQEKKRAFFDYLTPVVEQYNSRLRAERSQVERLARALHDNGELSGAELTQLQSLAESYHVDTGAGEAEVIAQLLKRVDIIPPSLALSQAASESGWGTSRFAQQGNNLFGEWCFREGCGLVPARRGAGRRHEVARFDSPRESVASYMHNLNTNPAYRDFRRRREQLRGSNQPLSGVELADGLTRYSERGHHYVRELRSMILSNRLHRLDMAVEEDKAVVADRGG